LVVAVAVPGFDDVVDAAVGVLAASGLQADKPATTAAIPSSLMNLCMGMPLVYSITCEFNCCDIAATSQLF